MKRLFLAIVLCSLMLTAAFLTTRFTAAQSDPVISLLTFPAPPPKGTVFEPAPPKRPEDFYSKTKVPDDNAPIEELMDYWGYHGLRSWEAGYLPRPSKVVIERIKDELERRPKDLPQFLRILPRGKETSSWVKTVYDNEMSAKTLTADWRSIVRDWLLRNSPYFSEELAKVAEDVKDDEGGYVTGQAELVALARVDWDKAKPIIDRMLLNPSEANAMVAAKWAQYAHAIEAGAESDVEKYRSELQRIVGDKNATSAQRDIALDALVKEKDWSGRDEWYFSLFSDETLLDLKTKTQTLTGLTTIITESAPDRFKARLISMIESGDPNVRSAAAQALSRLCADDADAAGAMLPWLENPNWAKDANNARSALVISLAKHSLPESVPGLIAMLDEAATSQSEGTGPQKTSGESAAAEDQKIFPLRSAAISALQKQRDPRAVPALRRILFSDPGSEVGSLVNAIYASGGFSTDELAQGVEVYIRETIKSEIDATANANTQPQTPAAETSQRPVREEAFQMIGFLLGNESRVSDEAAAAVAARADVIDSREPVLAERMRSQLAKWKGPGVDIALLQMLARGKANADGVLRLLIDRKSIRERNSSWVSAARSGGAFADGITACIMEDQNAYAAILESESLQARAALYACGRLIRAPLPVEAAARDLNNRNGVLSLAAEKYLETVDTPETRTLVLSKHKGEARILGPFYFFEGLNAPDPQRAYLIAELVQTVEPVLDRSVEEFDFTNFYLTMDSFESDARKVVLQDKRLVKLYAFKNFTLRQYPDKVLFSRADKTGARYWERELRPGEFEAFEDLLAGERSGEVRPVLSTVYSYTNPIGEDLALDGVSLLVLSKDGGHRLFSKSWNPPRVLQEIERLLMSMGSEEGRPKYHFELEIPGAETIFAGNELRASAFWKNGADMRVLVKSVQDEKRIERELDDQEESESNKPEFNADSGYQEFWKRRQRRRWESYSWYNLAGQSLGSPAQQPEGVDFIPQRDAEGYLPENDTWKASGPGFEIRADERGIFKISGGQTTPIKEGGYAMPVVSPDGRYVIAQKLASVDSEVGGDTVVKVNLSTKSEKAVRLSGEQDRREPVAYIPALGKFLLFAGYFEEGEEHPNQPDEDDLSVLMYENADFFLLDPVTNLVTPAGKGYAAFAQQTFRPLQPTGRPNEFWVAMPSFDYDTSAKFTSVGVVNSRTGKFRTLVTLNKVFFDSMALWVEDRVYFAYQGHIVSIPKPKLPATP